MKLVREKYCAVILLCCVADSADDWASTVAVTCTLIVSKVVAHTGDVLLKASGKLLPDSEDGNSSQVQVLLAKYLENFV